jgi:hypothetical protein
MQARQLGYIPAIKHVRCGDRLHKRRVDRERVKLLLLKRAVANIYRQRAPKTIVLDIVWTLKGTETLNLYICARSQLVHPSPILFRPHSTMFPFGMYRHENI